MPEREDTLIERLIDARDQIEEIKEKMSPLKEHYQTAKSTFDSHSAVTEFRSLKKELEFWKEETRRLGLLAWKYTTNNNPIAGVQVQHGKEMKVVDEKALREWAEKNLPKAVIVSLDLEIISKYAELVEEAPDGTRFVDTHKVIIRKLPEKEVE